MWKFHFLKIPSKQFIPLLATIVLLLIMVFSLPKFILPHFLNVYERWQDLARQEEELAKLQAKVGILGSVDLGELRSLVSLLERVLPSEKDAFSVINSINDVAKKSGGVLDDFSYNPGLISSASGQSPSAATLGLDKNSFRVQMNLPDVRLVDSIKLFYSSTPVNTITHLLGNYLSTGEVDVEYQMETYTQALPKSFGTLSGAINPLTTENKDLISRLMKWENPTLVESEVPTGTASGKRKNLFSF